MTRNNNVCLVVAYSIGVYITIKNLVVILKFMLNNPSEFRREIMKMGVRVLRPKEFKALLSGCPKQEYRTMLQAMLYTGMRYIELQRFQKYPSWFDGEFIHLPRMADRKVKRTQRERWVRLNQVGKTIIEYFTQLKKPLPSYQSWSMNLKCWARRVGLSEPGLSAKCTRKTWESWLVFYYHQQLPMILLSQGHNTITSIQHYMNVPFTETDRIEMKNYVEGWI